MKPASIVAFVALITLPLSSAFAWKGHKKENIKAVKDASAALQSTNPDLSSRLNDLATRESSAKESAESSTQQKDDIQLLHESANALQSTRPDLSKELTRFADEESREMNRGVRPMHRDQPSGQTAPSQQQERSAPSQNQSPTPQGSQGY